MDDDVQQLLDLRLKMMRFRFAHEPISLPDFTGRRQAGVAPASGATGSALRQAVGPIGGKRFRIGNKRSRCRRLRNRQLRGHSRKEISEDADKATNYEQQDHGFFELLKAAMRR